MYVLKKINNQRKGQSIVEFALLLPILLIIIMGIIQFGLILSGYITISNAAREGARVGIIDKTSTSINSKVDETFDLSPTLSLTNVSDIPDPGVTSNPYIVNNEFAPGQPLSVKVYGDVKIIVPFLDTILGQDYVRMSREATMMIEGYVEE